MRYSSSLCDCSGSRVNCSHSDQSSCPLGSASSKPYGVACHSVRRKSVISGSGPRTIASSTRSTGTFHCHVLSWKNCWFAYTRFVPATAVSRAIALAK